uniref:Peptidase S1 domain-containing protein n=1 Tax=Biomphalaria glabrata TaxID=6526 RepID=A0A2C9KYZ0_BIOGL
MGTVLASLTANKDLFYGTHEVQVAEANTNPEESSKRCARGCCSDDMVDVDKFTLEHLPIEYRQDDIFNLAQAIASLTVKLKVTFVSDSRPQFIPKTDSPYPLYDKRGSGDFISMGSGRVCDVVQQKGRGGDTCKCSGCKISPNPSKNWWTIKIFTATAVVYDSKEANQTSCTFFDHGGENDHNKFKISGCRCVWLDVEGDLCLLEIISCNKKLCELLFSTIKTFNVIWQSLNQTFKNLKATEERLIIIVSHPHGDHKRISVGHGVDIGTICNLGFSKYIYNAPTCLGSSGGPVYALGNNWFKTEYVHSGYRHDVDSPKHSPVYSKSHSEVLDPSNLSISFINAGKDSSQTESIFFTNTSCADKTETLAGAEYIPQTFPDIEKYVKYKGYSTRWY